MPELPEVETSRRGIEPYLLNKKIKKITIRQHKLRWPIPQNLAELATGKVIHAVSRRAKYIYLELDNATIIIHLGMSGSLRICTDKNLAEKHDHIDIQVSGNKILRFRDPRKFGCVLWAQGSVEQHKLIQPLGPEPLSDIFTAEYLHNKARKRQCSIKSFIMNSHIVVGIGNIYASEALFRARINPKRKAGNISLKRLQRLVQAIKSTLESAIIEGGTTLRDFTGSSGQPGYFAQKLLVYGKTGENCSICGNTIKCISQQARSTFYCTQCQK